MSGCLASRGVNIDSLVVSETETPGLSRMTIVLNGGGDVDQARKQLEDLVQVWAVVEFSPNAPVVEREGGWQCADHGSITPLWRPALADYETFAEHVRRSTILFFRSLTAEEALRSGTASQNPITVRALGYIIAGHELHHMGILKERYL